MISRVSRVFRIRFQYPGFIPGFPVGFENHGFHGFPGCVPTMIRINNVEYPHNQYQKDVNFDMTNQEWVRYYKQFCSFGEKDNI